MQKYILWQINEESQKDSDCFQDPRAKEIKLLMNKGVNVKY